MERKIYRGENMSLLVLGRAHVKTQEHTPDEPHVLISITDPYNGQVRDDCGPAELYPSEQRLDTLRLEFFDIDEPIGNLPMMTEEQAESVVGFIKKWQDKISLIVVHCEAGIARSAGVAAGLSKWLNGEDSYFYTTFNPNSWVYHKVLFAVYGDPWVEYRTEQTQEDEHIEPPFFS